MFLDASWITIFPGIVGENVANVPACLPEIAVSSSTMPLQDVDAALRLAPLQLRLSRSPCMSNVLQVHRPISLQRAEPLAVDARRRV